MITTIIILSVLLILSIYVNINLLRKNEDITDRVMDQDDIIFSFLNKALQSFTSSIDESKLKTFLRF